MSSHVPYDFDIICVYNNAAVLHELLMASLELQTSTSYRFHGIDNTNGAFTSAIAAFQTVLPNCQGRWVMFVHQDVSLLCDNWLEQCAHTLRVLGPFAVAGVAGMAPIDKMHNIDRGRNQVRTGAHIESGKWWPWGNHIEQPAHVQTVDELLFIIPNTVLHKLPLDTTLCDGWHLYGVNYCIAADKLLGLKSYAIPLPVYHRSSGISKTKRQILLSLGPLPKEYYATLQKLMTEYRDFCPVIYTTCSDWKTHTPLLLQRLGKLLVGAKDMVATHLFNARKNQN